MQQNGRLECQNAQMDDIDQALIAQLRQNARATVAELAHRLRCRAAR